MPIGPVAFRPDENDLDRRYSEEAVPVETLRTLTLEPLQAPSISKAASFTLTRSHPLPLLFHQVLQQAPLNPSRNFLLPLLADEGPLYKMTLQQSPNPTDSGI